MVALVLMCPKCWHLISLVSASPLSLAGTWPLEARSAQPVMAALISLSQSAQHPIQYILYSSYFLGNNFCLDLAAFISLVHFDQLAQHPISIYFMAEIFSAHNFDFLFFANICLLICGGPHHISSMPVARSIFSSPLIFGGLCGGGNTAAYCLTMSVSRNEMSQNLSKVRLLIKSDRRLRHSFKLKSFDMRPLTGSQK